MCYVLICSGDCGVYVLKFLEFLISKKNIMDVNDANMEFFRRQLTVDLFFHNAFP